MSWEIPWYVYWVFFAVTGILILACEEEFSDKDAFAVTTVLYFSAIFFLLLRWIFNRVREIINLRNSKKKTELLHLQSQVNPHFFFNILNNLYGWVGMDPKHAQDMILKLSDMMRYSIYDGQKDYVTLEAEVDYLNNYIALHQLRYHKSIDIKFEVQVSDLSIRIKPLLFLILLENAFKHGVENLTSEAFVHIMLSDTDKNLLFKISNNYDPESLDKKEGIGLNNLRRRLVLAYPKKHKLKINRNENVFNAELLIKLQ